MVVTDIVTDKKFYLNRSLKALSDLCIKRQQKKWDNLIIIDGDERSGKTTLMKGMSYYYAYKTGCSFTLKNVFFDPEEMLDYAIDNRGEIIVWDEAAFGGLSSQWQNKIQKKLNSMLMATGKYGHFYVFIIPSFFRLNRYLALDRSIGLLHVYSPDMLTRGYFTCFSKRQKTWIYNNNKKSETYGKDYSFRGQFTKKNIENNILDEKKYEAKKDAAIKKYLNDMKDDTVLKLKNMQYTIASKLNSHQVMELMGVSEQTYYNWLKIGDKLGFKSQLKVKT